jgi:hypothetical protein
MHSDWREIADFLSLPAARVVYLLALTLILVLIAVYALFKLRDKFNEEETDSEHLTNFRELRERGVLREFEYRTIKAVLAQKLRREINRDGENS